MKFDLSIGKILLGFSGMSVAVFAYKFYSSNKNEEDTSSLDDYLSKSEKATCVTDEYVNQNGCFEDSNEVSVKSTQSSKMQFITDKINLNDQEIQSRKASSINKISVTNFEKRVTSNIVDGNINQVDIVANNNDKSTLSKVINNAENNSKTCNKIEPTIKKQSV